MSSFWFDPMVQTVGMPGYGGGPQINTDYGGQLAQQQAYVAAQQPSQAQLYGGGSFGAQPAAYAALGAAYGRATGGYGGLPGRVGTIGSPGGGGSYDDSAGLTPSTAYNGMTDWNGSPIYSGGGIGSDAQRGGQGGNYGATFNDMWSSRGIPAVARDNAWFNAPAVAQQMMPQYDFIDRFRGMQSPAGGGGIGSDAHRGGQEGQSYSGMTDWRGNPIFNPGTYAGDQGNYGIPFNNRPLPGDVGFSRQPTMPNLGYNPGMANSFANPGMNANQFQNRFGMGFPNAGTPSQYAPGARMPLGFSPEYSVDQPGGALPLNWGQGGSYQPGG